MSGPYVNDDGDVWVERGSVPWPQARREAAEALVGFVGPAALVYDGIELRVLVSDREEQPCESAWEAEREGRSPTCGCCRVIDAYSFHWEDR